MDASTTALSVARHLKARGGWSQLTVITNGLRIASELAGHPGHHRPDARRPRPLGGAVGRRPARRRAVQPDQRPEGVPRRGRLHARVRPGRRDRRRGPDQALDGRRGARGHRDRRPHEVGARGVRHVLPDRPDRRRPDRRPAPRRDGRGALAPAASRSGSSAPDAVADAATRRPTGGPSRDDRSGDDDRPAPTPPATAPPRAELRGISKRFARDPGPRRRLARPRCPARSTPSSARTAPARARWSRSWPASTSPTAARSCSTASRSQIHGPGPGARARDRGRPPGAAPLPRPDRRRERVHRPRPVGPPRHDRLGRDAPGGRRRCSRSSTSSSTSARRSAACRWPTSS